MSPTRKSIIESEGRKARDVFYLLEDELVQSLTLYWTIANAILHKGGIQLKTPTKEYFSLENNFFSALFLYSYIKGDLSKSKRILYTSMNQCLRGMVTGCDNILDNEYKKTLDTDLPLSCHQVSFHPGYHGFRSYPCCYYFTKDIRMGNSLLNIF